MLNAVRDVYGAQETCATCTIAAAAAAICPPALSICYNVIRHDMIRPRITLFRRARHNPLIAERFDAATSKDR